MLTIVALTLAALVLSFAFCQELFVLILEAIALTVFLSLVLIGVAML